MITMIPRTTVDFHPWHVTSTPTKIWNPAYPEETTASPNLFAFTCGEEVDKEKEAWKLIQGLSRKNVLYVDSNAISSEIMSSWNVQARYYFPTFPIHLRSDRHEYEPRRHILNETKATHSWDLASLLNPDQHLQFRKYGTLGKNIPLMFINLQPFIGFFIEFNLKITGPLNNWIKDGTTVLPDVHAIPAWNDQMTLRNSGAKLKAFTKTKMFVPDIPNVNSDGGMCTGIIPPLAGIVSNNHNLMAALQAWIIRYFSQTINNDWAYEGSRFLMDNLIESGRQSVTMTKENIRTWFNQYGNNIRSRNLPMQKTMEEL